MSFLRKRLFVAYALVVVLLGLTAGTPFGERFFPQRHRSSSDSRDSSTEFTAIIVAAHVLIVAFVLYLHAQSRNPRTAILQERPRSWLILTYGAYSIGFALGIAVAIMLR